jgi:hypothetical protein
VRDQRHDKAFGYMDQVTVAGGTTNRLSLRGCSRWSGIRLDQLAQLGGHMIAKGAGGKGVARLAKVIDAMH